MYEQAHPTSGISVGVSSPGQTADDPDALVELIRTYRSTKDPSVDVLIWQVLQPLIRGKVRRLIRIARLERAGLEQDLAQDAYFIFRRWLQFADLSYSPKRVLAYLSRCLQTRLIDALGRLVGREAQDPVYVDCDGWEYLASEGLEGGEDPAHETVRRIVEQLYGYGLKLVAAQRNQEYPSFSCPCA